MDPTRHYFLVRSCPGFMPISFLRDSKEKEKAPIIRDGIQGESEDTEQYPHNNKQANQPMTSFEARKKIMQISWLHIQCAAS